MHGLLRIVVYNLATMTNVDEGSQVQRWEACREGASGRLDLCSCRGYCFHSARSGVDVAQPPRIPQTQARTALVWEKTSADARLPGREALKAEGRP